MKKVTSLLLVITFILMNPIYSFADEIAASDIDNVVFIVDEDDTYTQDILLDEDHIVTLSVRKENGMVYANAHGRYYLKDDSTASSYGMYVSFTVDNSDININNGGQFTAYHNAAASGYVANYEKSISGEGTSTCTAKTKYTLTNSDDTKISIKLEIYENKPAKLYFSGNFSKHDSEFDLD